MKHKTFVISVLLSGILLFAFITAGTAHGDAILFPWVVKSTTASTMISVVNTAGVDIPGVYQNGDITYELHYQYYYKKTIDNQSTETCEDLNIIMPTSKNDIVTFDASGQSFMNNGKPLYNDSGPYYDEKFDMSGVEIPRRAFLIVDNNTPGFVFSDIDNDASLYGEALIIDHSNGLTWGYTAYNARILGNATGTNDQVSFRDGYDYQGEVIGSNESGKTVILPPEEYVTRYYVTPIGLYGQRSGNINTSVYLSWTEDGDEKGMFDNDENPFDFHQIVEVVCTGAIDLTELIPQGAYNVFLSSGKQGWAYVQTETGTVDQSPLDEQPDNPSSHAVIGKLEWFNFYQDIVIDLSETTDCISCKEECLERCLNPKNPKAFKPFKPFLCNRQCGKLCKDQCFIKKSASIWPAQFTWIRSGESLPPPPSIFDDQTGQ
jgi:hypothetical protein